MSDSEVITRPEPTTKAPKGTRSRPVLVRKHKQVTAYKEKLADTLDKVHAAGETVAFILPSPDIRGFEIVSYTEE